VFEVVVKGVPDVRQSAESVRNLLIDTPDGGQVRLDQVADVRIQPSPAVIKRDAVQRYVDVEADVSGRSLGAVAGDVQNRLNNGEFPLEYHAEVLEQTTTGQEINLGRVAGLGLTAVIAIFLLLQAVFRSWRLAGLAFLTLPVALVGGVLATLIDGATLSLGSLIAFLALLGIATRNGVMLIDRFQRLRLDEAFGAELVRRGARDRFAPTLTVAVATAAAVLPLVIMGNVAGLEIIHPMAIVILGGLLTSTLLSLFILPTLYLRFGAGAQPEPVAETPLPPGAAAEPVYGGREVAAEPERSRRFEGAPGRRADAAAYQEDGEGTPPERRGE
jgi:Cu/Ag efflux pump CusA